MSRMTAAMEEALAYARGAGLIIETVELWHPLLTSGDVTSPIRAVNDIKPLTARLEADAPRNAGQMVTFLAIPFEITLPSSDESTAPRAKMSIATATADMHRAFKAIAGSGTPVEMIYRAYTGDNLQAPGQVDDTFSILSITTETMFTAGEPVIHNLERVLFPRRLYDRTTYPAL